MRTQTCCFTGHRDIPVQEYPEIQKRLAEEIENLIKQGITTFLCGGALGFDTLAALTVLEMKQKYPNILLSLALPHKEQEKYWREKDKKIYNHIRKQADAVVVVSENYFPGCMQKRNRFMVDRSCVCVCYLTKPTGGTAYTVHYAAKNGLRIVRIDADKDLILIKGAIPGAKKGLVTIRNSQKR